jgi:hypothetical protein
VCRGGLGCNGGNGSFNLRRFDRSFRSGDGRRKLNLSRRGCNRFLNYGRGSGYCFRNDGGRFGRSLDCHGGFFSGILYWSRGRLDDN